MQDGTPPTPLRRSVLPACLPDPGVDMSETITLTTVAGQHHHSPTVSISTVTQEQQQHRHLINACDSPQSACDSPNITNNNNTIKYADGEHYDANGTADNADADETVAANCSAQSEELTSACDSSLGSADTQPPQPFPRSILNTSNGTFGSSSTDSATHTTTGNGPNATKTRPLAKKSVSFETDDEKIRKFINGEVIVDQQNPFKSALALKREEFFSNNSVPKRKPAVPVVLTADDFISTEDVLKESKFVKTYVKNPDKYFERDPEVLDRLRKELEAEQRRVLPVRKSKLSRFNPASIYAKAQVKLNGGTDQVDRGYLSRNRSIDRSRYPDLSDIKVKVGTDLEESLYNPDEVTLNAKRFDDRIKNSSFGSQDDLEDIAELTSTSLDSVGDSETAATSDEDRAPKSFTNTVNSQEFQEFLMKKGLSLTPKPAKAHETSPNGQPTITYEMASTEPKTDTMETKKPKKPSVLQRLFPGRHIFSSKRRTTPKDPSPEPKPLYATLSDEEVNKSSDIKRVVLERKSFHAGQMTHAELTKHLRDRSRKTFMDDGCSSISSALTNAENYVDMSQPAPAVPSDGKKRADNNKENYVEMKANWADRGGALEEEVATKSSEIEAVEPQRLRSLLVRPKTHGGRSSVPVVTTDRIDTLEHVRMGNNVSAIPTPQKQRKDQPVMFESTTPDVRDGCVIKPRVQRVPAGIPIGTAKPLDRPFGQPTTKPIKPPVPLRRVAERQSMIYKKPTVDDSLASSPMSRAVSMDKAEIKRRSIQKPLIRAKPINLQSIPHVLPVKPMSSSVVVANGSTTVDRTPRNSSDNLLSNNNAGPLVTSTPISTAAQPNFYFHKKPASQTTNSISPISPLPPATKQNNANLSPNKKLQLDPYSWAKLRELKEQTDRQLYGKQPITVQTATAAPVAAVSPKNVRDHIYGRTEEPPTPHTQPSVTDILPENIYEKLPRHRDRNSMAGKVESVPVVNTIQAKAQVHSLSPQEEYRQQMLQLQQQYQQQQQQHQQKFFEELKRQKEYQEQQQMQQLKWQQHQQHMQQQQQRQQQQAGAQQHFVRNSPQRNTIGDIYRQRDLKLADGKSARALDPVSESEQSFRPLSQASSIQQPARCQSVLGSMIASNNTNTPQYATLAVPNNTTVVMRPKPPGKLSREEIMNRVTEFCRKSMNKTPTKYLQQQQQQASSAETSPTSYASVSSGRSSVKPAPQVPQRVQSLANNGLQYAAHDSPIYAPIIKRGSIQSTASELYDSPVNRPPQRGQPQTRQVSYSETDSVFLHSPHSTLPGTPTAYYLVNGGGGPYHQLAPSLSGSSQQSMDAYGRIYSHEPLYDSLPPPQPAAAQQQQQQPQRTSQIYYPINGTLRRNQMQLNATSGRATPLILQAIPQQPVYGTTAAPKMPQRAAMSTTTASVPAMIPGGRTGTIVVLDNVDQMYRPMVPTIKVQPTARPPSRQPLALHRSYVKSGKCVVPYESESCSEAEEVQRILQTDNQEEDWQNDKARNQQNEQVPDDRRRGGSGNGIGQGSSSSGGRAREDPRRHTLGGDMLGYAHQGQLPLQRSMDLEAQPIRGYTPVSQGPLFDDDPGIMSEVETASTGFRRGGKQRSSLPVVRTPSKTLERPLGLVFLQYRTETKRALLPNEITSIDTVRALFVRSFPRQLTMAYLEGPNVKIYIHDASKDMFYELEDVRTHLREIRDRSVLRLFESNEVAAPQALPGGAGVPQPLPSNGGQWDQDQSYFSEPEFDSDYQHQHVHKSKTGAITNGKGAPYYVGGSQTLPRGGIYNDRNKNVVGAPTKPLRSYGSRGSMGPTYPYPPDQLYSIPDGYMSSPERGTRGSYEEPYYSQYGTRGGSVTPVIDEEQSEAVLAEDQYALYGHKVTGRIPRSGSQLYDPTRPEDLHRIRVEHMERQLANLTGLVQKALTQNVPTGPPAINSNYLSVSGQYRDDMDGHSSGSSTSIHQGGEDIYVREKPPKLGKSACHKSVSFEKSVSFSDDIHQGATKSHIPQHPAADSKPPKPAIKSSTLPRTSSQERDRLKPPPPPKPASLAPAQHQHQQQTAYIHPDIALAPEVYNHLRGLQKKAKDLRVEMRTLRRLSQAQAVAVREDLKDAFMGIRATLLASSGAQWGGGAAHDQERQRLAREEEMYKQEVIRLEKDLADLESSVEGLRGEVINRRTRVNMTAVEDMALVLSRASKTVAELKLKFPNLQNGLRNVLSNEMEKVVREEKFLKDEPDRLESALRRCKKLTGTLVTLKRLASVQEQRLPCAEPTSGDESGPRSADAQPANKPIPSPRLGPVAVGGGVAPENALDALLDELQTFAKPPGGVGEFDSTSDDSSQTPQNNTVTTQLSQTNHYPTDPNLMAITVGVGANTTTTTTNNHTSTTPSAQLRRLHSYPSGSDTDTSPPTQIQRTAVPPANIMGNPTTVGKPPVPERNADLLTKVGQKRIPPPPPPRTSSRSPLASPTGTGVPLVRQLSSVGELSTANVEMLQHLGKNGDATAELHNNTHSNTGGGNVAAAVAAIRAQAMAAAAAASGGDNGGGNSSGSESTHSQEHGARIAELNHRQDVLLLKQKELHQQYARLQQLSKNSPVPVTADMLKKTGSESNLPQKMGLSLAVSSGSMRNINAEQRGADSAATATSMKAAAAAAAAAPITSTTKHYSTEIL